MAEPTGKYVVCVTVLDSEGNEVASSKDKDNYLTGATATTPSRYEVGQIDSRKIDGKDYKYEIIKVRQGGYLENGHYLTDVTGKLTDQ